MEKCANCDRDIGKMETPHVHDGNIVCGECKARLDPQPVQAAPVYLGSAPPNAANPGYKHPDELRAFGLSNGGAIMLIIVGLLLAPVGIGILLIIWAIIAMSEIKRLKKQWFPDGANVQREWI